MIDKEAECYWCGDVCDYEYYRQLAMEEDGDITISPLCNDCYKEAAFLRQYCLPRTPELDEKFLLEGILES